MTPASVIPRYRVVEIRPGVADGLMIRPPLEVLVTKIDGPPGPPVWKVVTPVRDRAEISVGAEGILSSDGERFIPMGPRRGSSPAAPTS